MLALGAPPSQWAELPEDFSALLAAGWRRKPSGALILGDTITGNGNVSVQPGEIGSYEYRKNSFTISNDDLAQTIEVFAKRLAGPGPLMDQPDIDYRQPGGNFPSDISDFLAASIERGLVFARRALARAQEEVPDCGRHLIAVVSTRVAGDILLSGTRVRFTTCRGEPSGWFDMSWFEDLNRFASEAMAVLDVSDA